LTTPGVASIRARSTLIAALLLWLQLLASPCIADNGVEKATQLIQQKSYEAAARLMRSLARKNDPGTTAYLASLYEEGNGVPKDYRIAKALYAKVANSRDPNVALIPAAIWGYERLILLTSGNYLEGEVKGIANLCPLTQQYSLKPSDLVAEATSLSFLGNQRIDNQAEDRGVAVLGLTVLQ
jgi:TPR repeat protein